MYFLLFQFLTPQQALQAYDCHRGHINTVAVKQVKQEAGDKWSETHLDWQIQNLKQQEEYKKENGPYVQQKAINTWMIMMI